MFRYYKRFIAALGFLVLCFTTGFLMFQMKPQEVVRMPASEHHVHHSESVLAVSAQEFQDSKPVLGRSFFDKIFSENGQYQVPYPFSKVLNRLSEYTGQKINNPDSSGIKVAIIPMGRSLQRNAAIVGERVHSIDHYFRYPRIVVGVDEEPTHENSLLLNVKNKIYLGFNERAQVIEAISYNEEAGRYEYQVVHNYGEGKSPEVIYANRSLCLSCHQNQSPIFSRGPWSETNANPVIAEKLQAAFDQTYGKTACVNSKSQVYCYQDKSPLYFGAPIYIESNVTRQLDTSTDLANLTHAYQKMWKEFCLTEDCKIAHLQSMILYRLTGQEGIRSSAEVKAHIDQIEKDWRLRYPWGWAIPSPDIPDRDPLKDVQAGPKVSEFSTVSEAHRQRMFELLSASQIPNAFEPLLPRAPVDVWKDTGIDGVNANRLIRGFAQEFTATDIKLIDQWLKVNRNEKQVISNLISLCEIQKDKMNLIINCKGETEESFSFEAVVDLKPQTKFNITELNYRSKTLNCTDQDFSCPRVFDLQGLSVKLNEKQLNLSLHFKNGLGLKTAEGYDMAEVQIDLDAKIAQIKVYDPVPFLKSVLQNQAHDLFPTAVFNRFQIMKTILAQSAPKLARYQDESFHELPLKLDPTFKAEQLEQQMNGFAIMKTACTQCHQSNVGSVPQFMGTLTQPLNDFEMCRQIEQCAPRMIYRLKMRQCKTEVMRTKKNAMPPAHFFKDEASLQLWANIYNPKILQFLTSLVDQKSLMQNLISQGINETQAQVTAQDILNSDCPDSDSSVYEQLPKCEFNKLKPFITMTKCR